MSPTRFRRGEPVVKRVDPELMSGFLRFAQLAADGKRRMLISHSRQIPDGYASTTETADYLLHQLKLERKENKRVGPVQTQQLSEARRGNFVVLGFEGDTAADHVDLLHALPDYLKLLHAVE